MDTETSAMPTDFDPLCIYPEGKPLSVELQEAEEAEKAEKAKMEEEERKPMLNKPCELDEIDPVEATEGITEPLSAHSFSQKIARTLLLISFVLITSLLVIAFGTFVLATAELMSGAQKYFSLAFAGISMGGYLICSVLLIVENEF